MAAVEDRAQGQFVEPQWNTGAGKRWARPENGMQPCLTRSTGGRARWPGGCPRSQFDSGGRVPERGPSDRPLESRRKGSSEKGRIENRRARLQAGSQLTGSMVYSRHATRATNSPIRPLNRRSRPASDHGVFLADAVGSDGTREPALHLSGIVEASASGKLFSLAGANKTGSFIGRRIGRGPLRANRRAQLLQS